MGQSTFINALFLCLVNVAFMIAGMFLNSVVIVTLKRSTQLRKKPCYFLIFVLCCCDLAAVTASHPVVITKAICWFTQNDRKEKFILAYVVCVVLTGFSVFALLTLSVERFLALKYPFFHQISVTKTRLVVFLGSVMIIVVSLSPWLYSRGEGFRDMFISVLVSFLFLMFIYLNYNMFIIAKAKRKAEKPATSAEERPGHAERKRFKLNFKNISTCSLAIGCFFVSFCPKMIYSALCLTLKNMPDLIDTVSLDMWLCTLATMNSTFNCLIFFWRHSVLRREGIKILKWSRRARSSMRP